MTGANHVDASSLTTGGVFTELTTISDRLGTDRHPNNMTDSGQCVLTVDKLMS